MRVHVGGRVCVSSSLSALSEVKYGPHFTDEVTKGSVSFCDLSNITELESTQARIQDSKI